MQRFFGEHYQGVKAEVDMRREVADLAKAMDSGQIPSSPEAAQAIIDRQQDLMANHTSYVIPTEDLDFDSLRI
ncbi:MAG: hypothetical protein DI585_05630 [Pseudomonas fluorescens]|nr:MAG: hypothetical protein DI585_05630 [Pseudomonas fluorescens]